jgi:hypothetical protein
MLDNPRRNCFAWQPLGDVNVIFAFTSKNKKLGDIDVTQPLSNARLFFESLPELRIDAFYRDQSHGNRFPRPFIHRFVSGHNAIATEFIWLTVRIDTDSIVLKENRALHNRLSWRSETITFASLADDSTSILAASCFTQG